MLAFSRDGERSIVLSNIHNTQNRKVKKVYPVTDDKLLMSALEFLRQTNQNVYLNIKRNAQAALKMELVTTCEHAFLQGETQQFHCFSIAEETAEIFCEYCHLSATNDAIYLYVRQSFPCAAIYCVSGDNIITQRKYLYTAESIQDIQQSFESSLQECLPPVPRHNLMPISFQQERAAI